MKLPIMVNGIAVCANDHVHPVKVTVVSWIRFPRSGRVSAVCTKSPVSCPTCRADLVLARRHATARTRRLR